MLVDSSDMIRLPLKSTILFVSCFFVFFPSVSNLLVQWIETLIVCTSVALFGLRLPLKSTILFFSCFFVFFPSVSNLFWYNGLKH